MRLALPIILMTMIVLVLSIPALRAPKDEPANGVLMGTAEAGSENTSGNPQNHASAEP